MSPSKTATLNLRIDPRIKEAVRIAALQDHRSIADGSVFHVEADTPNDTVTATTTARD
jgi:hypothetical protein